MSDNFITRTILDYAFDESLTGRHMIFLSGPRQVGKTMLARHWLAKHDCRQLYFNWDDISVRQAYLNNSRFFESPARTSGTKEPWIVFDEIHKRTNWRDILKGAYDLFGSEFRFLITGSARLDLFRHAGDSLIGRYNLFHMLPLSLAEAMGQPHTNCFLKEKAAAKRESIFKTWLNSRAGPLAREAFELLLQFGPFPEPFLRQTERFCRKWHQDYQTLLVREELRDISRIVELDKIENLLILLTPRIMAPLSMANLARELEAAHTTVKSWLEQLKRLYLIFPVAPWSRKVGRGLRKERKWYFVDWYFAPAGPARLENMVATALFRTCRALTDMGHGNFSLHYVRTLDKRKIDFIVARDNSPTLAVEVKTGDTTLSGTLRDRAKWALGKETIGIQVVNKPDTLQRHENNTWIMSVERFLAMLI